MGCYSSRDKNYSHEEGLVSRYEEGLGFYGLRCQEIDIYFHKFAQNLKLTDNQFLAAAEELKLDMRNYSNREFKLYKFYESFRMDDGLYSARMLSALGILIGKGNTTEKANALFTNYDIQVTDTLDYKEMLVLITDIVEIAMVILPAYAKEAAEDPGEKKVLEKYKLKLREVKTHVHEFYESLLIKDESIDISISEFLEMFNKSEIRSIVWPRDARLLALNKFYDFTDNRPES